MNKLFLLILTLAGAYPIAHCANNEFEPNLPLPLDVPAIEDNRQSTLVIERNGVLCGAAHIRKAKILDSGYANISGFVGGVISFGPFACATYKLSSVLKIDSAYRVYFAGILTPIAASLLGTFLYTKSNDAITKLEDNLDTSVIIHNHVVNLDINKDQDKNELAEDHPWVSKAQLTTNTDGDRVLRVQKNNYSGFVNRMMRSSSGYQITGNDWYEFDVLRKEREKALSSWYNPFLIGSANTCVVDDKHTQLGLLNNQLCIPAGVSIKPAARFAQPEDRV